MRRAIRMWPDRPAGGTAWSRADCGSGRRRCRVFVRSANGWLAELIGAFTSYSASAAEGRSAGRSSNTAAASLVACTAAGSAPRQRERGAREQPGKPTTLATRTRAVQHMRPRRRRGGSGAPWREEELNKADGRRLAAKGRRAPWSRTATARWMGRCAWGISAAHNRSMGQICLQ